MRENYSDHGASIELGAAPGAAPVREPAGSQQRMTVDGEEFSVCEDGRGGTSYTWISGPNDGYGFGSSPTSGLDEDTHVAAIRTFLHQIDPKTGYIA